VGRLVTKKGHTDLIQACQQLKQKGYGFDCEIFGTGPLVSELKRLIKELDLEDRVSLQGARTQEELIAIYQAADIFALAPFILENGDRDGLPNVLLEAMASGLPVVATRISGIPELIVNGENGLLVEPHDVAGLASALEQLLFNLPLRVRLAAMGRRRVEQHFSAQDNIRNLAELFGFESGTAAPGFRPQISAPLNWGQRAEVQR
jgi:glycosyltransferase involved in cell wall biosynthesis